MSSRASVRGRPARAVISQTQGRSVPAAAAARVMDRSNSFRHESEGGEEIMIKISVGAAAADEEEDVWGEKLWENSGEEQVERELDASHCFIGAPDYWWSR